MDLEYLYIKYPYKISLLILKIAIILIDKKYSNPFKEIDLKIFSMPSPIKKSFPPYVSLYVKSCLYI